MSSRIYNKTHLTSTTTIPEAMPSTTAEKAGGVLHTIVVNNPGTTSTLTVVDSTGTIAVINPNGGAFPIIGTLIYDCAIVFPVVCTIAGSGGDFTVTWA